MLSENQKAVLAQWFSEGASLDEIQKRLKSEFDVHLTYLELRLLVAELPQPQEAEPAAVTEPPPEPVPPVHDLDAEGYGDELAEKVPPAADSAAPAAAEEVPTTELTVTVDPINPPGVMACGGVTFSDGTTGKWFLDQMGRLGLNGVPAGYRPAPQDAALFQTRLMEALRAKGLM